MRRNTNIYLNSHSGKRPNETSYLSKNTNNDITTFDIIYSDYNPWKDTYIDKSGLFN
jgi:hypothetical protein